VSCPSTCEYLREARKHEPTAEFDPATAGNPDIRVNEEFLEDHAALVLASCHALTAGATESGAVDSDVREALASLIQAYRTLRSGVIYEGLPANPLAANLHRRVQLTLGQFRREETRESGITQTRDEDVLGVLVVFERMALDRNNGRPRCRAFLEVLPMFAGVLEPEEDAPPRLIL